jgi:hypothetical protein
MLEWRDRWSRTAVHWAVLNGHVQCLKALLQLGASPSPPNARHGAHLKSTYLTIETPLQLARRRYRSGVGGGAVGEEVLRLLSAAVSADAQVATRETRLSVALLAAARTDRDYHVDGLDEESLTFLRCGETPPPTTARNTFEGDTSTKQVALLLKHARLLMVFGGGRGLGCPPVA